MTLPEEPSLPAATPSAKEETSTSGGPAATPSDPARCEVCGREKQQRRFERGARNDGCIRDSPEGESACYRLGCERLLSERKGLREALAEVKRELEESDWTCERCGQDFGMTETDIYLEVGRALAATSAPQDNPKVTK